MAEKQLSRVYLFDGDDVLKREMLLQRLTERVAEYGDLSMNSQQFAAREIKGPAHVLDALNTIPFGSQFRLVVITEADQLDKAVQSSLVDYLADPSETTVLALVTDKLARNTRLYKVIAERYASSIIDCSPKKRTELPQLIRNIAKAEGVDILGNAASLMVERLGVDTVLLSAETKKLAAIVRSRGDTTIKAADVTEHVTRQVEPKRWDLTNALSRKDLPRCLACINEMKSFTATGLFMLCISHVREILQAKTVRVRGGSVAQAVGKQEWQIKELLTATELFSFTELKALLKEAPVIESRMKSGSDADQLLRLWVIDVCAQRKPQS